MSKGSFFTGQPIFTQILNYIPRKAVQSISLAFNADRYCKKFRTYDHLVTMLYCILNRCTSLREVATGLLAWEQRLAHLGLQHYPRRSTISDANNRRSEAVFEQIYYSLYKRYSLFLSDSCSKSTASKTYIFDASTITLFQEVLKGTGLPNDAGKRKGGIKVHTLIRSDQDVPCMVRYSAACRNDAQFLKQVLLPKGSIIVFDKGYPDYISYNRFSDNKITWVTRRRTNSVYTVVGKRNVDPSQKQAGVRKDLDIVIGHAHNKKAVKVKARLIIYHDFITKKDFEFITNNTRMNATTIAGIYKKRWQIELLFKRIKQNYPLQYFLGDSENAIKIQIWCALIADLLLKVIKKGTHCKWAYSNLSSMIRLHLMTYIDLKSFVKAAEKILLQRIKKQLTTPPIPLLFDT